MDKRWNSLLICLLIVLSVYVVTAGKVGPIALDQTTKGVEGNGGAFQSKNATYYVGPGNAYQFRVNFTLNLSAGLPNVNGTTPNLPLAYNVSLYLDIAQVWGRNLTNTSGLHTFGDNTTYNFTTSSLSGYDEGVYRFNIVAVNGNATSGFGQILGQTGGNSSANGNGFDYNWSSVSNYTFYIDKSNITLGDNQSSAGFNLTDGINNRFNSSIINNFSDVGYEQTFIRNGTTVPGTLNLTFTLMDAAVANVTLVYNATNGPLNVSWLSDGNGSVGVTGLELSNGRNGSIGTWINATGGAFRSTDNGTSSGLQLNKNVFLANLPGFQDNVTVQFAILVNDTAGNQRFFGPFNFTTDGSKPTGPSLSVDKVSVPTTGTVTVSCDGSSDVTSGVSEIRYRWVRPGGIEVVKVDSAATSMKFGITDFGGVPGDHEVFCRTEDALGFQSDEVGPVSVKVYLSSTTTGGGGGGGTGAGKAESKVAELDISTEAASRGSVVAQQGETKTFTVDGSAVHKVTFLTVGLTTATLRFESEAVDVTLSVGETKSVDLDGDSTDDVEVTLNKITDGVADISIENLEVVSVPSQPEVESEPEVSETGTSSKTVLVTVLIIAGVLVLGFLLVKASGKGKGKKGEIKFTRKDLMSN